METVEVDDQWYALNLLPLTLMEDKEVILSVPCVCLVVCLRATLRVNHLTYDFEFWHDRRSGS